MKKLYSFALLIFLSGFITNTATTKTDLHPDLNSPLPQSARATNFKTGIAAPDKTGSINKEALIAKAASIAVPFVKNVGQFNGEVKYTADLFSGRFFLTNKELVYSLFKGPKKKKAQPEKYRRTPEPKKNMPNIGLVFKEFFVNKKGTKIDFKSTGEQQADTKVSYFKGNDASKWRSGVSSYQVVSLGEVYPGIEVKLKASGKNVEKIFYINPQSNVAEIKIGVVGIDGLKIDKDGKLIFKNSFGELAMRKPIAWQEIAGIRREVKVGYRLLGKYLYGFTILSDYAKDRTLIIDPDLDVLMASTFLGGSKYNYGYSLVLDNAGNVYVTGCTHSPDFPTTDGAYDRVFDEVDAFVSKLNNNLTALLASTFLSGDDYDSGLCLALDSAENVYLIGETKSTDFPTTVGAYDRTFAGDNSWTNVFVSKLNGDLTQLLASTFIGGSVGEDISSLALDRSGNVYLAGYTRSWDFPTTVGAYDRTCNGIWNDAFVSKLNGSLTTLLASTFLGGSNGESCYSLALDSSDNVYLTGGTSSPDFPITVGAYNKTFNNNKNPDVFVSKLNSDLTKLLASTFLGGNDFDWGHSLVLDNAGNIYLTGNTGSSDFPTTPGAYDRTYHGGLDDVFISCLNNDLTTLLASTFLGGSKDEEGKFLVLDSSNNVYLTGLTASTDFPTTAGSYDQTYNGGDDDVFVAKLNSSLSTLLDSTYLGGSKIDYCSFLILDSSNNVYLTGYTHSKDFPTTIESYDNSYNGDDGNVFISILNSGLNASLDLVAERREAKAFSILRQYCQINFSAKPSDISVVQYRIVRSKDRGDFALLRTIAPSELQNNQFQMQDKYLEKDTQYTYKVEAYGAAGQLVGYSAEKTI
jgi:hypothetical protein